MTDREQTRRDAEWRCAWCGKANDLSVVVCEHCHHYGQPPTIIYRCVRCERGREACQYCESVTEQDWEAMCDCGLFDFGRHLLDCKSQAAYKYVIASDHTSGMLPR